MPNEFLMVVYIMDGSILTGFFAPFPRFSVSEISKKYLGNGAKKPVKIEPSII